MVKSLRNIAGLLPITLPAIAQAQASTPLPSPVNSGDTAWLLTASALVLFMTLPGLALFYGGLVRARNFLSIIVQCFAICCAASLIWAVCGYSLAFADGSPFIGGLSNAFLANLTEIRAGTTVPETVYVLFQMTFAIITPALFIGAFVERVRFGWVMAFSTLWMLLVYIPVCKWVWGGGWLANLGALDFAGGIVVHTTAGVSALVTALLIGPRHGFKHNHIIPPHSPALTMVGAGMLWFGWFGFNGGSALSASDSAATAILNTHLAASMAALIWIAIERVKIGKATSIGIVTGAVAGLATITPAAGYVGPMGAIALGAIGSVLCFYCVQLVKHRFRVDDSLDVFAVHGVGGMLGSLLLAVFAFPAFGGPGFEGQVTMGSQFIAQFIAVAIVALWSAVMSAAIAWVVSLFIDMRVDQEAEYDGLDLHSHGERAYDFD
ncbi:ammonium transporter [Aquisediminimonas sediminicola]|uniref:ammonium transporter n=1 Tax=Alteraquisediminimonas sediminicola TaxID=2676787 RepID=UPI001C8DE6F8|nr:ammonium transporter [Aquisediminimonas sediminicola]